MMGCEDSITVTLIGNSDFRLLLWNLTDVELLRTRHRMICSYVGCLPSNPLQNIENSLPALMSYEQLLVLLEAKNISWGIYNKYAERVKVNLELLTPIRRSSLTGLNISKELSCALPKAPLPFLLALSRLNSSPQFSVYKHLYSLPSNFFITSGSKFGGDFLLYYDDPSKCHSQHIVNVVDFKQSIKARQLVSFGRLATGVGKTRVFAASESFKDETKSPRIHTFTLEWSGMI